MAMLVCVVTGDSYVPYWYMDSDGRCLVCTDEKCVLDARTDCIGTVFRKEFGNGNGYQFQEVNKDGTGTGKCLRRKSCHKSKSFTKLDKCDDKMCGAIHLNFADEAGDHNPFSINEDNGNNCIASYVHQNTDHGIMFKHCAPSTQANFTRVDPSINNSNYTQPKL